ncbi:9091_t:CDS:1, partial [Gigaspora rosea]
MPNTYYSKKECQKGRIPDTYHLKNARKEKFQKKSYKKKKEKKGSKKATQEPTKQKNAKYRTPDTYHQKKECQKEEKKG